MERSGVQVATVFDAPFRAVAELATDAMVVSDESGRLAYANPAAERMLGYDPGELNGRPLAVIIPARHRDAQQREMSRYLESGEACLIGRTAEIEALHRDGSEVPVELTIAAPESSGQRWFAAIMRDVSERREAQLELARSEAMLAHAARVAGIGSWEWSVADDVLTWSDEMYRVYGLEPRSFDASFAAFMDRVHPDDLEHVANSIQCAMTEIIPFEFEHRIVRPGGEVRTLHCRGSCLAAGDGRLERMFGIGEDVTERRDHERALQEAEALFRGAFDQAPIGMALGRADGSWARANDALVRMLGYSREELTTKRFQEVTHPDDIDADLEAKRAMLAGERDGYCTRKRYIHRDGHVVWISLSVALVRDGEGAPLYFVSQMEDITERKRMDLALGQAEERFRRVFEQSPVGIVLVGEDGRFVQVNDAFCSMTGYAERELLELSFADLTHPDDVELDTGLADAVFSGHVPSYQVEKRYLRKGGSVIWVALTAAAARSDDGSAPYGICIVENVTERKRFEGRLQYFADHDPLTGLLNRRRFESELDRQVTYTARYRASGAVLLMDLDNFKYVNDTLGHRIGDELIRGVADVVRSRLRGSDVLARLGGDEFAVVLPEAGRDDAERVAEALRAAVAAYPMTVDGRTVRTTASIGVTLFDEHTTGADRLIVESDLAMYAAKHAGRDRVMFYEPDGDDHTLIRTGFTWSTRLREALEQDRFVLHAQPIVDVSTGETSRYELLIRMLDEDGSLVPPATFLSTAERFGFIEPIDRWVACQAIDMLAARPDLTLEVNVSGKSIGSPDLLAAIERRLRESGADATRLIFEVTETAAITNMDAAREFALSLRRLGCKFALDDFGAGFGSFVYLKHLPVDYLKLDGDFIRDLPGNPTDQLVVRAMVDVARGLGQRTIAEFVGSEECFELLRDLGVDYAQGFWLGKPAPLPAAG
ncbi:MAG: PAS domain S-box protein [Thermoleophilaceae bacterium]